MTFWQLAGIVKKTLTPIALRPKVSQGLPI